jgi:hypothetical protein
MTYNLITDHLNLDVLPEIFVEAQKDQFYLCKQDQTSLALKIFIFIYSF